MSGDEWESFENGTVYKERMGEKAKGPRSQFKSSPKKEMVPSDPISSTVHYRHARH
jgi:hypothetical protein